MNIREAIHWKLVKHPLLGSLILPFRKPARAAVRAFHFRQIRSMSATAGLTLVQRPPSAAQGRAIAILTVRNEMERLPSCLTYHRALGMTEFYVVDNGSTDGTVEYLRTQPDVTIYRTEESYKDSFYGITWVNNIAHKHAAGRWVLFIDADELLFYPRAGDDFTIGDLTECLDRAGQTYLYAPMVDLYGFDDAALGKASTSAGVLQALEAGWMDVEGYRSGPRLANGYLALQGGPRGRLANSVGEREPYLVKYPLVKHFPGRYFTASAHEFMPSVAEDHTMSGWLVHLKLGNDANRRHADPAVEQEHYGSGRERRPIAASDADGIIRGDASAIPFRGIPSLMKIDDKTRCPSQSRSELP